jgi:alpha-tubulin suppressor-like RCC1 family protein
MSTTLHEPILRKISCGEAHTVVVAESGMGFSCGEGKFGELGNERFRVTQNLDMIKNGYDNDGTDAYGRKRIIHVTCGAHHTLLITSDGFLYTFGDESHGALGNGPKNYYRALDGNKRSNNIPMLNRFLLSYDYDPTTKFDIKSTRLPIAVTYCSAGDGFSVVVDQSGTVWSWGSNTCKMIISPIFLVDVLNLFNIYLLLHIIF